ncbi:hypothetical protein BN1110_03810 [bacterium YEK0313]|nr:hypothetical protein BN1110_03810 [bacterium YEK0313]
MTTTIKPARRYDHAGPAAASWTVTVAAGMAEAAAAWQALEADAVFSAYQRHDWCAAFLATIGAAATPCLAVIGDADGRPQGLLPLAIADEHGLAVAGFIGGKHCNFGMGLWRPAFAASLTAADLDAILDSVARQAPRRIDLFRLASQPACWDGFANPLRLLPHLPAASDGYHLRLGADAETVLAGAVSPAARRKLRKKERALAAHGPIELTQARTPDDIHRFTDSFLALKAARCRAQGITDTFAVAGARAFIVEGATGTAGGAPPPITLFALTVAGEPVAVFGGAAARGRFSGMFTAVTSGPLARHSPGEILLHKVVRACCDDGLDTFDLGVGRARYKASLCPGTDPLFDQHVPVTWRGQAAAAALGAAVRLKRQVKDSARLWPIVEAFRRARARLA